MVVARQNGKPSSTINESRCVLYCIILYYLVLSCIVLLYYLFLGHPTSLAACPVVASPLDPSLPDHSRRGISDNQIKSNLFYARHVNSKMSNHSGNGQTFKRQLPAQPDSQLNANPSLPSSPSCSFQRDLCAPPDSSNVPLCSNTLVLSSCCRHVPKSHDPGWLSISVNQ